MNTELLQKSFDDYKLFFFSEENEKHEIYKWKILKQVFERWNWNAEDKIKMFRETFQIKGNNNLWTSVNYYPVVMALRFFDEFPLETIEAFSFLFNEDLDLLDRINSFKNYFDNKLLELRERFPNEKLGYHSQELRSISLYLFLQFPEKYYLYKFNIVKTFTEKYGFNTIIKGRNENYISYLETANKIKEFVKQDDSLIENYYKFLEDKDYYQDKSLNLLTQDFMYSDVQHLSSFKTKRYWLYAPGEGAYKWEEFFSEEIMALGWDDIGDLTQYKSKSEIQAKLISTYESDTNRNNDATANFEFANNVNIGDTIIVKKGRHELLGYGEVISDYYFDESREDYKHCRKVEWKLKGNWAIDNTMVMKTFTDITSYQAYKSPAQKYYEELMQIMLNTNSIMKNQNIEILEYKKQIILQGPPGTGKTREAKLIAKEILGLNSTDDLKDNEQFKLIQFHPSYTYEDFVRGIVAESKGDKIEYKNVNKTLGEFAEVALKNYTTSKETGIDNNLDSWIDTQFELFKEDIKAQLPENEIPLSGDITIYDVADNSFKYGKNWKTASHILFGEFKSLARAVIKNELELSNKQMDKEKFRHAHYRYTYYNALLEKFFQEYKYESSGELIKEKKYILVIDEINRANLSSVLGELIYALEYRNESVHSPYGIKDENNKVKTELILPPNLYIIGTMNTADRSVGHIDYAIRRRFAFVEVLPEKLDDEKIIFHNDWFKKISELFIENYDEYFNDESRKTLLKPAKTLSSEFRPEDVWLGHSYFIQKKLEDNKLEPEEFRMKIDYEIKPILMEYVKDGVLVGNIGEQKIEDYIKNL